MYQKKIKSTYYFMCPRKNSFDQKLTVHCVGHGTMKYECLSNILSYKLIKNNFKFVFYAFGYKLCIAV